MGQSIPNGALTGHIVPQMFGVVGAGDDALLVQAAIDQFNRCHLPTGTYNFRSWLNLTGSTGAKLTGDGVGRSIIRKPNAAPTKGGRVIYLDGAVNAYLEGFEIDGNGAGQTAYDEDAAIEIWNQCSGVTIRNVRIRDALRYGIYIKGEIGNQSTGVTLDGVKTAGSLGTNSSGTVGALGQTGVAVISCRNFKMHDCEVLDGFDIEPNTVDQWVSGEVSGNTFRGRVDLGLAAVVVRYDPLIFARNRIYKPATGNVALTLHGGIVVDNTITAYDGPDKIGDGGVGVMIPSNNAGAFSLCGNRIIGFGTGVGVGALQHDSLIADNVIDCHETEIGTTSIDGGNLNYGGIVLHPNIAVRGGSIDGNQIAILAAFATDGGYAVESQGTNVRGLGFTGNRCVIADTEQLAPVYLHVTDDYSDYIEGNAAAIKTNLTGAPLVLSYRHNVAELVA